MSFLGRADDLWRIHFTLSTLRVDEAAALTGALEGGGGFGKTRLALEYLHRLGPKNYPGGIFWVDADVDSERLEERFHGILRTIKPDTPELHIFRECKRDAANELGRAIHELPPEELVLFIIDNVPEPIAGSPPKPLRTWCPALGKVAVLATSRARLSLGTEAVQALVINALAPEPAALLLTKDINCQALAAEDWRCIANWVGCLPLALELLNRTLNAGGLSPAELLARATTVNPVEELDRQMEALHGVVPVGQLRGITEALTTSYQRLLEAEKQGAHLISQLAPDPIPIVLLTAIDPEIFSATVRTALVTRSFVTQITDGVVHMFGCMHRVLADFIRSKTRGAQDELRVLRAALTRVMNENILSDPTSRPLWEACLPHAEWILKSSVANPNHDTEEIVRFALHVGTFLRRAARGGGARQTEEIAVNLAVSSLGAEHPLTLEAQNRFAILLRSQGDHAAAKKIHDPEHKK